MDCHLFEVEDGWGAQNTPQYFEHKTLKINVLC